MKLEELMTQNYSKLNESDRYILKYILKNKKECNNLGLNELANKCNVSTTTIVRCVKKIGFEGYKEFKVHLKWKETDAYIEDDNKVEKLYVEIDQTINHIKDRDFTRICKLIYEADRIFVYGTGATQRIIAQALSQTFLSVNKYLVIIEAEEDFRKLIDTLPDKDLIIIISFSGNTTSLEKFTSKLSIRGIKYISITKLINNKLSTATPYNLYSITSEFRVDEDTIYISPMTYYILIEVLFRHYVEYEKQYI